MRVYTTRDYGIT